MKKTLLLLFVGLTATPFAHCMDQRDMAPGGADTARRDNQAEIQAAIVNWMQETANVWFGNNPQNNNQGNQNQAGANQQ